MVTAGWGLGGGFAPMAEPLAELHEEEPEDIHLSKQLG